MNTTFKKLLLRIAWLPILLIWFFPHSCRTSSNNTTDHPALFNAVIAQATRLQDMGAKQKALAYVDSVYNLYPNAGPGDLYQKYYFKTTYYRGQHNYKEAALYADSILSDLVPYAHDKKYNLQYAEATLLKGDILFDQGIYSYAYQYYYLGKRIAEKNTDSCAYDAYMAHFNGRMATISYKQEDYSNAIIRYKDAIGSLRDCNGGADYFYQMQGYLSNIAFGYEKSGMPDSALYYYSKSLNLLSAGEKEYPYKKDFIAMSKGVIYGKMGDAYMAKGQLVAADSLYHEDILINSKPGYYKQDALLTQLKLAGLYVKMGRLADASAILEHTGSSPDLADNDSRLGFLQTLAAYHTATKEDALAFKDLQLYIKLKDSVQLSRRKLVSTNVSNVFQVLQQENDISALKKKDQFKDILLIAAVLFLLMALLLILLTIRNSKTAKKHNEEIRQHNKEQQFALLALEQSNRENARLASVLAHDLKNPVHAMSAIADIMLHDKDRSAEDKEMLGLLKDSGANVAAMIDDVLINRNGKTGVKKEPADLAELLKHSVALLQFKASEKGQHIQLINDGPVIVQMDSDQVWRVVNNLLVNAIKFSKEQTTITVTIQKWDSVVRVSVADQGIGIPDEFQERIFDAFTTAQRTGTSGEETFGLGLYISKHIVEAHGGKIGIEQSSTKGSTFYFTLPLI